MFTCNFVSGWKRVDIIVVVELAIKERRNFKSVGQKMFSDHVLTAKVRLRFSKPAFVAQNLN